MDTNRGHTNRTTIRIDIPRGILNAGRVRRLWWVKYGFLRVIWWYVSLAFLLSPLPQTPL